MRVYLHPLSILPLFLIYLLKTIVRNSYIETGKYDTQSSSN